MDNNDHKNTWEGFTKSALGHNSSNSNSSSSRNFFIVNKIKNDYWIYKRRFIIRKKGGFDT